MQTEPPPGFLVLSLEGGNQADEHWQATNTKWVRSCQKSHMKPKACDNPNAQGKWASVSSPGNSAWHNLSGPMFTEILPLRENPAYKRVSFYLCRGPTLESYLNLPVPASSTASASQDSCRNREETSSEYVRDRRTSDVVSYVITNGWQDHQPARLQREALQTRIFFFLVKQVTIYIKWVCFETVLFCYSYSPCRPGWSWTGGQHSPASASQGLRLQACAGNQVWVMEKQPVFSAAELSFQAPFLSLLFVL